MRTHIGISVLALSVALVVTPASAQLLDLGNSGNAILDLDLGSDAGVTVDLGATPDVSVDLGSDSDADLTVDLGDTGDDVIDLEGNSVGVDLGEGDENEVMIGLPGDDSVYVDLFGKKRKGTRLLDLGNQAVDAVVDLDAGGDGVIVELFGDSSGEGSAVEAAVGLDVLNGAEGSGPDLSGLLGAEAIPDLFGDGGSVGDIGLGDVSLPGLGNGVDGVPEFAVPSIAVPGLGAPGSDSVDDDDGDPGVAVASPPAAPDADGADTGIASNNDTRLATSTSTTGVIVSNRAIARTQVANAKCFTPDAAQIAHLVQSRTYSDGLVSSWRSARAVSLVPVQICPEARVQISQVTYADANMEMMREGIAHSPVIRQKLQTSGLGADDVLAVDTKDGGLTVYVY